MKLRVKVWIEGDGRHLFGRGRAELLETVARDGSIQVAARRMGLSYRRAWTMLRTSEQRLGRSLVESTRGGAGGGGTRLTEAGRRFLHVFRRIESRFQRLQEEAQVEVDRLDM